MILNEPQPSSDNGFALMGPPQGDDSGQHTMRILRNALRGRYHWLILMALLLGLPGAYVGYTLKEPVYTSRGIIEVKPTLPRLLYASEESQLPPLFDSFVSAQATILRSSRVIEIAASDEDLIAAGWPTGPKGMTTLQKNLDVDRSRGGQLITLEVTHPDQAVVQEAVDAVLRAYQSLIEEEGGMDLSEKESALVLLQDDLQRNLKLQREKILKQSQRYGTNDLSELLRAKVDQVINLESRLSELEFRIIEAEAGQANIEHDASADAETPVEMYAAVDPQVHSLLNQRMLVELELEDAATRALGPSHEAVRTLNQQLDQINRRIDEQIEHINANGGLKALAATSGTGMTLEQMRQTRDRLISMKTDLTAQVLELGQTHLSIKAEEEEAQAIKSRLDDTSFRLEQLRIEAKSLSQGRVAVRAWGDEPLEPSDDPRKKTAVMGGAAGAGTGVLMVTGLCMWRRRYRFIDEIEDVDPNTAILGVVPDLGNADADALDFAALSIHNVRNMLQVHRGSATLKHGIIAVTSACSGDGKTSLTLALGMSFALEGLRTIVVDADLTGRGLSHAFCMQEEPGLSEALAHGSANGEIQSTPIDNMWILPSGCASGNGAVNISRAALQRLLNALADEYDVVLVDTGPLLGSLEATLAVGIADQVVLAVARGQEMQLVEASLKRLDGLYTHWKGVVFNRAAPSDLRHSTSHVSFNSKSVRPSIGDHGAASRAPWNNLLFNTILTDRDAVAPLLDAESSKDTTS